MYADEIYYEEYSEDHTYFYKLGECAPCYTYTNYGFDSEKVTDVAKEETLKNEVTWLKHLICPSVTKSPENDLDAEWTT